MGHLGNDPSQPKHRFYRPLCVLSKILPHVWWTVWVLIPSQLFERQSATPAASRFIFFSLTWFGQSTLDCLICQALFLFLKIYNVNNKIQNLEVVTGFEPANIWFAISFLPIRTHYHKLAEDWDPDSQTLAGSKCLANTAVNPGQLIFRFDWQKKEESSPNPFGSHCFPSRYQNHLIFSSINWRRVGGIDPLAFRLQLFSRQC